MAARTTAGVSPSPALTAAFAAFSPAVPDAWASSFMASFPSRITRLLLAEAHETQVRAGDVFYRGAYHEQMAMLALVAEGQLRIYRQTGTGRQVTMLYHYPGAVVGAPALLLGGAQNDTELARQPWLMLGGRTVYGEAVRGALLLRLSTAQFLHLVRTEASVARPLATYLAQRAATAQQMLTDDLFLSIRARVARHLIDLAVLDDGVLTVSAGHQEIADAIGSVREVATRALGDMRRAGLIARRGNQTMLTDIEQLRLIGSVR
jgi:CRP-like cAMP-binding protein